MTNQRKHTRPLKLSKIWFSIVSLCLEDHTRASTLNSWTMNSLATGQTVSRTKWWMKKYLFELLTTQNLADVVLSLAKFELAISLQDHRHRYPVFSLVSLSNFLFHVFSVEEWWRSRDCLHPPPLSAPDSRNIFFEQKTDIKPGFFIGSLFWSCNKKINNKDIT